MYLVHYFNADGVSPHTRGCLPTGGVCPAGVCVPRGWVGVSQQAMGQTSPSGQNDSEVKKTLPCPKLRLRAAIICQLYCRSCSNILNKYISLSSILCYVLGRALLTSQFNPDYIWPCITPCFFSTEFLAIRLIDLRLMV